MVAVCTGPAFSVDGTGRLIIGGQRVENPPSGAQSLATCNGLYTNASGNGLWTVDHVYINDIQWRSFNINHNISGVTTYALTPTTYTPRNDTCWHISVQIVVQYRVYVTLNTDTSAR